MRDKTRQGASRREGVSPCYGPPFPARAKEKGDHNMDAGKE